MKSAYLILYFWHSIYGGYNQGGTGGPVVQIISMPSMSICETIGKAAKEMIDKAKPANPREEDSMSFHSYPAVFSWQWSVLRSDRARGLTRARRIGIIWLSVHVHRRQQSDT